MSLKTFSGAAAVLAAQSASLPQPDQLCGPFSAAAALAGIVDVRIPTITELAVASGSMVWAGHTGAARPAGVAVVRTGWNSLESAADPGAAGTSASGLVAGIEGATDHAVAVVPISAPTAAELETLMDSLMCSTLHFGVVCNVRTRFMVDIDWDVGHFVAAWGYDEHTGEVAIADTYAELGTVGMPPGCRLVPSTALADAMTADGGRGLLVLVPAGERDAALGIAEVLGLRTAVWST
nr:hypothetical protein [Rhodococcus sp. (in: high G+C Gram-positive bacteria)]